MNTKQADPVIDEVREVRKRISKDFGHDPDKLVAHYIQLQEQYRSRLIGVENSSSADHAASRHRSVSEATSAT